MRISITLFLILLLSDACVERINIDVPKSIVGQLVIEGQITDEPGPYVVKISRATSVNEILVKTKPVSAVRVAISDDMGNVETLTETELGTFQTSENGIRGTIGRSYILHVETNDGKIFESVPEKMVAVGEIQNLYYQFESNQPADGPTEYGFRFFIDAKAAKETGNLLRWKFNGIFKVITNPELYCEKAGEVCIPKPRPCSGYIFSDGLVQVGPCTCCECWPSPIDSKIKLSDNEAIVDGIFKNIEVGFVTLNYYTAQETLVEVKQYSLSPAAFDFWKTLKDQKEGSSSLFQPAIGRAKTNIFAKSGNGEVQGLFYASSVARKILVLEPKDLPPGLKLTFNPPPTIAESCLLAFKNSTNKKPAEWK